MINQTISLPGIMRYGGLSLKAGLKELDTKRGYIEAYAAAFGNVDSDKDITFFGAFKKTIDEWGPSGLNRIKYLRQHRAEMLLAAPEWLKEDDFGLRFAATILPTTLGKDTLILYEGGAITEHSYGYDIIKSDQRAEGGNNLREVRLWDVSAVTWGSNYNTPPVIIKSAKDAEALFDEMKSIRRILKQGITDETAFELEFRLKQFERAVIDAINSLLQSEPNLARGIEEPKSVEEAEKLFVAELRNIFH